MPNKIFMHCSKEKAVNFRNWLKQYSIVPSRNVELSEVRKGEDDIFIVLFEHGCQLVPGQCGKNVIIIAEEPMAFETWRDFISESANIISYDSDVATVIGMFQSLGINSLADQIEARKGLLREIDMLREAAKAAKTKITAVFSVSGGSGVTTIAMACALNMRVNRNSEKVLVIDVPQMYSQTKNFIKNSNEFTPEFLRNKDRMGPWTIHNYSRTNMYVAVSSKNGLSAEDFSAFNEIIDEYKYIIIDCGLKTPNIHRFLRLANNIIFVGNCQEIIDANKMYYEEFKTFLENNNVKYLLNMRHSRTKVDSADYVIGFDGDLVTKQISDNFSFKFAKDIRLLVTDVIMK